LQEKERDLVEQAILANSATRIVESLTSMDVTTMYAWLTVLEGMGFVDTPVPTIGDGSINDAISGFFRSLKVARDSMSSDTTTLPGGITIQDVINYYLFGTMPVPNG
jgi:hypothetical protein